MYENYESSYKKSLLASLVLNGFQSAIYSYKTLFKTLHSDEHTQELSIALAYLTEAHSNFLNAQTLWINNIDAFGEYSKFEELFHRFSVYNDELLTNARTDHSHQWSDMEFRDFVESFTPVAKILNIDEDEFWVSKALSSDNE